MAECEPGSDETAAARMTRRCRRARRFGRWSAQQGRRLGLLAYRPEHWTTEQWDAEYRAGSLGRYGDLAELARYSVLVGYIAWHAARRPDNGPAILDVGCGVGLLRERLDGVAFAQYVGVDLSAPAIGEADARGHARSRFVVGDVTTPDVDRLDLGRFDVVVLNEMLYYVPDPAAFLDRIRGLLQPEGVLVVSVWRHPGDRALWRTIDAAFSLVDRVEVRNRANPVNAKGWVVALYGAAPRGGRR
jgi:2-polyprenyl-3-methyl-5-hydroxy-6-metoxy-1,4-benzoquinol methylase